MGLCRAASWTDARHSSRGPGRWRAFRKRHTCLFDGGIFDAAPFLRHECEGVRSGLEDAEIKLGDFSEYQ